MPNRNSSPRTSPTLASLSAKLDKVESSLHSEIRSIRRTMTGSESEGQWGYKHRIERLEKLYRETDVRVGDIELKMKLAAAYAVGIGSTVGFITGIIATVIANMDKFNHLFGG